ncbi:MAG: response regulator transcription factor, partial [Defluviitaleaceae bacterium]|nr:response regulator transcription factor [Defluviitaleaceae bacterium]
EKSQVPIIMLTARAEEVDKVLGLEMGADDYVTKPFGASELMARVKANLRRTEVPANAKTDTRVYTFGDLSIDIDMMEVKRGTDVVELTRREYELLKFLALQKSQVYTRENLLEFVWGYDDYYGDVRTVDVTVRRLRSKLEINPDNPQYILTKRAVGYYFNPEYSITAES